MTNPTLDELGRLVAQATPPMTSGQLPELHGCPRVDVDDYGEITPPLTPYRLRSLLRHAVPAPYGKGEQTLTDPTVRHTWQIPSSMVTIDWDGRLGEVLDQARVTLGLARSARLRAEFQSLLVYERGQFFLPHQDSQKSDDMVASLVVLLPSAATGGELVVHDGERTTTYAASRTGTTLVVFYADQLHEVRPVRSGHRIALTYTLSASGTTHDTRVEADLAATVADLLRDYFATPYSRWGGAAEYPTRMAYLLDHEYAERGLDPYRLKGADAAAATVLTAAAELADCELVLALADVHEVHDEFDMDGDPIDADVTITHWVTPDGFVETTDLSVSADATAGTPSGSLRPYASEYEGYMGNYGNTMDRWYRRAALLLWPRRLAFAQRCETAPAASLRQLLTRLGQGDDGQVRLDLDGVLPSWPAIVRRAAGAHAGAHVGAHAGAAQEVVAGGSGAGLLTLTLTVAERLGDRDLAGALLEPFRIEQLLPETMGVLGAVDERYGESWVRDLLRGWATDGQGRHPYGGDEEWLLELPDLARAAPDRAALAREVLALAWSRLRQRIESRSAAEPTSRTRQALAELGEPVAALLEAATALGDEPMRAEMLAACRRAELLDMIVPALDAARRWPEPLRAASGVRSLGEFAVARLRQQAEAPARAADDWSIVAARSCPCELCVELDAFLADPARRTLEWPLAKDGRQHLHHRIDHAELPVSHVTRRTGRPFTLVLTKTKELFDRESREREHARRELARLCDARDLG